MYRWENVGDYIMSMIFDINLKNSYRSSKKSKQIYYFDFR